MTVEPALEGWFTVDEIIRLSGAPSGSHIVMSTLGDEAVELRVQNPELLSEDMVRLIYQGPDQSYRFFVQNSVFVLKKAYRGKGLGARSFCIEATAATALELFDFIRVHAVGDYASMTSSNPDTEYSGPYAWARFGFDADIPAHVLAHCDGELAGLTRVHQLMTSERGRKVWAIHATSLWLEFDLDLNHACWKTLNSYMLEKGIKVTS